MQSLQMSFIACFIVRCRCLRVFVGHVPIELSRVLAGFLTASETNFVTDEVSGKRKREVGLAVPGCYRATTNRKKIADILSTELKKIKEGYPYFELEIEQDAIRKPLLTKQARN